MPDEKWDYDLYHKLRRGAWIRMGVGIIIASAGVTTLIFTPPTYYLGSIAFLGSLAATAVMIYFVVQATLMMRRANKLVNATQSD